MWNQTYEYVITGKKKDRYMNHAYYSGWLLPCNKLDVSSTKIELFHSKKHVLSHFVTKAKKVENRYKKKLR